MNLYYWLILYYISCVFSLLIYFIFVEKQLTVFDLFMILFFGWALLPICSLAYFVQYFDVHVIRIDKFFDYKLINWKRKK